MSIVLFCIVSYFAILIPLSFMDFYTLQGQFQHLYLISPETYAVLLLMTTGLLLVDFGDVHANAEIREWMNK